MQDEQLPQSGQQKKEKVLWFRARNYGWGWTPSTWQGWTILSGYLLVVLLLSKDVLLGNISGVPGVQYFLVRVFVATILLFYICYSHGERPGWRWGKKANDDTPSR